MVNFNGTPFQYNSSITNVNVDNQLAGVLSQFSDDYIMDVVRDSLDNRFRVYSLPSPNVVAAFEFTFKQLTDGFSSYSNEIMETRNRVYKNIIDTICDYYDFNFNNNIETDYYSAAYCLYDFFVSGFTEYLKNFYTMFLISERESICSALNLVKIKKENESTFIYSKKLFNDTKLAAIHCNIEYVISQMNSFDIKLDSIILYGYASNITIGNYLTTLINDQTGKFFNNFYQNFVLQSKDSADILTYIKLNIQQIGGDIQEEDNEM